MQHKWPVFRFAPSPNGALHLGHAFSALFTHAMARKFGGRLLLRIEDIDRDRCRPEFEAWIYEDLAWLGIAWETPVRRQSEHFDAYAAALARLDALGVIYPCFASRKEIAAAHAARIAGSRDATAGQGGEAPDATDSDGAPGAASSASAERTAITPTAAATDPDGAPLYPGLYRDAPPQTVAALVASGAPYALRLNMGKAAARARQMLGGGAITFRAFAPDGSVSIRPAHPERWGDVILARKETPASYHLAVVTDDALQGVTHITRGLDLLAATDIHRVLQVLLGLPEPLYCHHRLILDDSGRKLAKSHRDKGLRYMRDEGVTPQALRAMLERE